MKFRLSDGGRKAAGFRGAAPGDCVCRAAAIVTGRSYREVYDDINRLLVRRPVGKRTARTGVPISHVHRLFAGYGWSYCPLHDLPQRVRCASFADRTGSVALNIEGHLTACVDGVITDVWDHTQDGQAIVYGFYTPGD